VTRVNNVLANNPIHIRCNSIVYITEDEKHNIRRHLNSKAVL